MWNYAVHPDEFEMLYQKAHEVYSDAINHNKKIVTSQHTNANLSDWKKARDELSKLTQQFQKEPQQLQREITEKLPQLARKADKTLNKLQQIKNWRNKVDKLEGETKGRFNKCLNEINEYKKRDTEDSIIQVDEQPRWYAKLDYSTRTLSELIDTLDPNKWQGSPRETLEGLLRKVAQLKMRD